MLQRAHRLCSRREYQRVYRQGKSWAHPLLVLQVLPVSGVQRIGISVGKKLGGAVRRNRVRRQLREILRKQLPGWKSGFEAVVVARAQAADAQFPELQEAVSHLVRRAHLPLGAGRPDAVEYESPTGARSARAGRSRSDSG